MRAIVTLVLFGCLLIAAAGQAVEHEAERAAAPSRPMALKTGKERLGEKATDEQRVNDCKVPPGRRTRSRPTACPWDTQS